MTEEINIKGRKRPVFPYFGGKAIHLNKLLPLIPEHRFYGEVFGGAASLLFYKKPVCLEVYNDLDSELINFFRVLRDKEKFNSFLLQIELTPYSREEFNSAMASPNDIGSDIEKAVRFFVIVNQSFGSSRNSSWSTTLKEAKKVHKVRQYLGRIEILPEFHGRFRMVQIEHLDWLAFCNRYNVWGRKHGFMYLDPPYYPDTITTKKGYKYIMSREEHAKLINWLKKDCNVKTLLSGYENPIYDSLLEFGWLKKTWVARIHMTAGQQKHKQKIECVWYNYEI